MKKRTITLFTAFAAAAAFASVAHADVITAPVDGYTGDYRLAFVVGRNITGYSFNLSTALLTDIGIYNGHVSTQASESTELSALGATWKVIGSTSAVNARVNTGTTLEDGGATDVPIYNLDGVKLFDGNADLWSSGSPDVAFTRVDGSAPEGFGWWTGTSGDGTSVANYLGFGTGDVADTICADDLPLTEWVDSYLRHANHTAQLLGMSSVITGPLPGRGGTVIIIR